MREILFRGKKKDNGEWVYGTYCPYDWNICGERKENPQIIIISDDKMTDGLWCEVIPETVGQYTGFTDKNGKKIFEGDIIQFCTGMKLHYIVEFDLGGFMLSRYDKCGEIIDVYNSPCEVIGNIHDDPELRKSVMNK